MTQKIALLAFEGGLPKVILESFSQRNKTISVIAFDEFPAEVPSEISFSLGKIGHLFSYLKKNKITHICLAGRMARPDLWKLRFDFIGIKTVFSLLYALRRGDDSLLRSVLSCFEKQGFETLSVADICPELVMPKGVVTRCAPKSLEFIVQGKKILEDLSCHDIGQSVAMCGDIVLAIEALEGTDAMILRTKDIPQNRRHNLPKPFLIKAAKKGQTRKADLPAFGMQTIENLHKAGFSGAVLEAGSVLLIDGDAVIRCANDYGLFLIGFENDAS